MSATHPHLQFLLIVLIIFSLHPTCFALTPTPQQLLRGFSASPQSKTTSFQSVLSDPIGNFSLGFLRQNQNQLALAILHVSSSDPFWLANPTRLATWSDTTRLSFNGSLVLSDPKTNLFWSTSTNGDTVVLLNNSNLQVRNRGSQSPTWQSFNFPTNTLVQDQNFTSSMSLVSQNGLYSLRLGNDFMGLYANHGEKDGKPLRQLLYWKHTALEAKAEVQEGEGPIHARVNPEGYLAIYQNSAVPVDVQKFNTFQQALTTTSLLFVRLEPDGNLKGYYWDVKESKWVLNYQAITETCELPNPCGSYGVCTPGGSGCSCLDNQTRFESGGCLSGVIDRDLCHGDEMGERNYWVLRRSGVEPPHKELIGHVTTSSLGECEGLCEKNCSCWGALYNNASGFCYVLDYPIMTMMGAGDESKVGYFKVRKGGVKSDRVRVRVQVGVVVGVLGGIVVIGVGICLVRMRWKRRQVLSEENGASPGPYKNLGSASFRSIEMYPQSTG